jgi:lysophospholipase L1-like esterase
VFYVPGEARTNLVLKLTRSGTMPVARDGFLACGPDGDPLPLRVAYADASEVVLSLQVSGFGRRPCTVYYGSRVPSMPVRSPEAEIDPAPLTVALSSMHGRAIPTSWDRLRYMLRSPSAKTSPPQRIASFEEVSRVVEESETTRSSKDKPVRRRSVKGVRLVTVSSFLLCPREGRYRFAVDCADAGFVTVDGELVAAWPGEHEPKAWQIGAPVLLRSGIHRLEVFNLFGGAAKVLRVGWRPPGRKDVVPIGLADLVGSCEAMETRAERMTRTLQPGFTATPVRSYSFRGDPNVFVMVQYKNLTENWIATEMESRWTFGDGARSVEKDPVHVFTAANVFKTSLEVRDALGFAAGCSDSVDARQIQPEEYAVSFDVTGVPAVSFDRDRLMPCLRVEGVGAADIPMQVAWEVSPRKGSSTRGLRDITPLGRQVLVPLPPVAVKDVASIRWRVSHRQVSLGEEMIRFVHSPFDVRPARVEGDRLYDEAGARLVLVPDEGTSGFRQTPFKPEQRFGRLVCVDDSLAAGGLLGTAGTEAFDQVLARLLAGRAREVRYAALPEWDQFQQSSGPLRKLIDVAALLRQKQADVAVLSVGLRDILEQKDAGIFERQAAALTDLVAVSMGIPVIWATPPPYASAPDRSRLFAAAIRRVAEARAIPVADLYTVFLCTTDSRHVFFGDNPLVLSGVGHRLAGQQIARALVGE